MIITMSHALNFDPNDGYWEFFYQVAYIGIRCMNNSILKRISTTLGPTCKGRLFIGMFSI
jgi:hypothetical protein